MLTQAKYFVAGQTRTSKATAPMAVLTNALEYLITNTFNKMGYLRKVHDTLNVPCRKCKPILGSRIGPPPEMQMEERNPEAIADLREYIALSTRTQLAAWSCAR